MNKMPFYKSVREHALSERKKKWLVLVEKYQPIVYRHVREGRMYATHTPAILASKKKKPLLCVVCGHVVGSDKCRKWQGRQPRRESLADEI